MRLLACLIVAPQRGYDEPAILSYAISSFCPTSADGLHPYAQRYSIATFWPSINPTPFKPARKAANRCTTDSGVDGLRNPITGICACCAFAVSGRNSEGAAAVPARAKMNARRLIRSPRRQVRAACLEFGGPAPSRL